MAEVEQTAAFLHMQDQGYATVGIAGQLDVLIVLETRRTRQNYQVQDRLCSLRAWRIDLEQITSG